MTVLVSAEESWDGKTPWSRGPGRLAASCRRESRSPDSVAQEDVRREAPRGTSLETSSERLVDFIISVK